MPWGAKDAKRFTKKADTPKKARQWSKVANQELQSTGSEQRAIKAANAVVKRGGRKARRNR